LHCAPKIADAAAQPLRHFSRQTTQLTHTLQPGQQGRAAANVGANDQQRRIAIGESGYPEAPVWISRQPAIQLPLNLVRAHRLDRTQWPSYASVQRASRRALRREFAYALNIT
jgi:hypothetical protein